MHAGERFKGSLKQAVRKAAAFSRRAPGPCSLILTYHSVGRRDHEMNVTPEAFRQQMRWLSENADVVPLNEVVSGERGVAITFDDGYRDNLLEAAPILAEYALPATVFVVAGRVGQHLDHDVASEATALMTWDELRALVRMGWEIGAHTMTHPPLSGLDSASQAKEIGACKALLEKRLGVSVESFAYPFGSALDYTPVTRHLVEAAGYAFAVSNRYGVNRPNADRWTLRRIWIDRSDSLASFRAKVMGRLDNLSWLDSPAGIRARRVLNGLLRAG